MKKILLFIMAVLGFAGTTKANVEWTIWEGSLVVSSGWDKFYSIPHDQIASLVAGDILYGEFSGSGYPQIYKGWTDSDKLSDNPVTETGKFKYELTSTDIATNYPIIVRGGNYTLTKLSILKKSSAIKKIITVSGTPVSTGNYATSGSMLGTEFTNMVENDYIFFNASMEDASYWNGQVGSGTTWSQNNSVNGCFWFKLTDAQISSAKEDGVYIGGYYINVTGALLYHPITSFSIGSIGMATFCANVPVSVPTGIEAYAATINGAKSAITLTKIESGEIPANTGVIIKGDAGSVVEFTALASAPAAVTTDLVGVTSETAMTSGDFILYNNSGTAEFRKVTATNLAANKAYLPADKVAGARSLSIVFDDKETTGISSMHNSQCIMHNEYYDLSGRRVAKPTKGLYIVNGKKVLVK